MAKQRTMRSNFGGDRYDDLIDPGGRSGRGLPPPPRRPPEVGTPEVGTPPLNLGPPVQSGPEWWEEPVAPGEEIEIPLPSPELIAEDREQRTHRVPGTSPWDEDVRPLFRYDVSALERTEPTRPDVVAYLNERRQQTDPEALEQEDRGETTWPAFMPFSGPPPDLPGKVEDGPDAGLILQLRGHPKLADTIRTEFRRGSRFLLRQSDDRLFAMPPGSEPEGFWAMDLYDLGSYALGGTDWSFSQITPRGHMGIETALKQQRDLRGKIQAMGDPPDPAGRKKLGHLRRLYREAVLNVEAQSGAAKARGRAKQSLESVQGINTATQAFLRVIPDVVKAVGIMAPGVPEDEERFGSAIYRAGRSINDGIKWLAPVDPDAEQTFLTSTLPSAIGSLGAFALPGGLVARLTGSAAIATGASAVLGAAMNMSNVYDEATQAGATERDRAYAAFFGALIGSSEALLPGSIFRRMGQAGAGSVRRAMTGALLTATGEGAIEAAQELGAEWLNNINAREFYDENREMFDNLGVSAAAGGSAGFWLSFVMSMAGQRARQAAGRRLGIDPSSGKPIPVTREDIDSLFVDISKRPDSQFARDMNAAGFGPEATRRVLDESDPQARYNLFQSEARRVANNHLGEEDVRAAFPQAARIDRAGGRSYRVAFDTVAGERSVLVNLDMPEDAVSDEAFASSLIEQSAAAGGLTVEVGGRTIVVGTDMDWWDNTLSNADRRDIRAALKMRGAWSLNDDAGNSLDADGVIWLASGKGADQGTIRHEWFHGAIAMMTRLGILTEEDIALLREEFGSPLTEREFFNEEAGANTYDLWALDPSRGVRRFGAFPKIRSFFRSIARPLGLGQRTVEDIFGDIQSGEALQRRIEQPTLLQPEPGTLAGTLPGAAEAARAQLSTPWYSGLSQAAAAMKQPRGAAPQMKATISKMPGVMKQEMEESGLNEYLDLKAERGEGVTRDEIEDYLAGHGVEVVEVIYGSEFTDEPGTFAGPPPNEEDIFFGRDTVRGVAGEHKYKTYITDGPHEGYAELLLRTPSRVNAVGKADVTRITQNAIFEYDLIVAAWRKGAIKEDFFSNVVTAFSPEVTFYRAFMNDLHPGGIHGPGSDLDQAAVEQEGMEAEHEDLRTDLPNRLQGQPRGVGRRTLKALMDPIATLSDELNEMHTRFALELEADPDAHRRILPGLLVEPAPGHLAVETGVADRQRKVALSGMALDAALRQTREKMRQTIHEHAVREVGPYYEYSGEHWDDPNVIVHIRFTERRDVKTGNRIAFVEEIQSDWHQAGRESGYIGDPFVPRKPKDAVMTPGEVKLAQGPLTIDAWEAGQLEEREGVPTSGGRHVELGARARRGLAASDPRYHRDRGPYVNGWSVEVEPDESTTMKAGHIRIMLPPGATVEDALRAANEQERETGELYESGNGALVLGKLPAGPFRGNAWKKLAIRRMLRWAVDNGFESLAFATGQMQADRYGGDDATSSGMFAFYDKEIPSLARDIIRKLDPDVKLQGVLIERDALPDEPLGEGMTEAEWNETPTATWETYEEMRTRVQNVDHAIAHGIPDQVPAIKITPRIEEKVGGGIPTYARAQVDARALARLDKEFVDTMGRRIFDRVTADHLTAPDRERLEEVTKQAAEMGGYNVPAFHGTSRPFEDPIFRTKGTELGAHFSSTPGVAALFVGGSPLHADALRMLHQRPNETEPPSLEEAVMRKSAGGGLYKVYLNLQRPLRLRDMVSWDYDNEDGRKTLYDEVNRAIGFPEESFEILVVEEAERLNWDFWDKVDRQSRWRGMANFTWHQAMHNVLNDLGHDGIVYLNRREVVAPGDLAIPRERHMAMMAVEEGRGAISDEEFLEQFPDATDSYIVFEASQAKSSDVIVRNEAGKIMLPSQRFKPSMASMRAQVQLSDAQLVTQARKKIVLEAKTYPEAMRLELVIGQDGKPVIDETIQPNGTTTRKVRIKPNDYDLLKAPRRPKDRNRAIAKHSDALVDEYNKYKGQPFVEVAREWYNGVRDFLQSSFGANMETLAQLFGATSANTGAEQNFDQAMEAMHKYAAGDYDVLLGRYDDYIQGVQGKLVNGTLELEFNERDRDRVNRRVDKLQRDLLAIHQLIEAPGKIPRPMQSSREAASEAGRLAIMLRDQARWIKELSAKQKLLAEGKPSVKFDPAEAVRKEINLFPEVPRRSNGEKYNMNSRKVLQVLYGNWLTQTVGPKTPTFAGNMTGRTEGATIDVWAARMLRRLLYSPHIKKWRILPPAEGAVQGAINQEGETSGQYRYAQEVIGEAARKVGMLPQEFQAVMWFIEKDVWSKNGWSVGIAAEKANFMDYARELDFARYTVGMAGRDLDAPQFEKGLKALRHVVSGRPRVGKPTVKNVVASRVRRSVSGVDSYVEPGFDVEFSVDVTADPADVSPVTAEMLRVAQATDRDSVFVSEVVAEDHPNARPAFELNFKRPAQMEAAEGVTGILRKHGIDRFDMATNEKGEVLGIRMQYVPDYDADLNLGDIDDFHNRSQEWAENVEAVVDEMQGHDIVGVAFRRWVSTIVYERAEYGKAEVHDTGTARVEDELGRRNRVREQQPPQGPAATARGGRPGPSIPGGDASTQRASLGAIEGREAVPGRPDGTPEEPLAPAARAKARAEDARAQLERHGFGKRVAGEPFDPDEPNPLGLHRAEREDLRARPGALYRPQSYRERRELQEDMSDEGLLAGLRARTRDAVTGEVIDSEENFAVLDGLELLDRIRTRIDDPNATPEEVAAAQEDFSGVMDEMDTLGMQAAQLVRQFAESRARNPLTIVAAIARTVESRGRVLSQPAMDKIRALAEADVAARRALEEAEKRMAETLSDEDIVAFDIAQKEADKALRAFSYGVADVLPPRAMPDMIRQLQQGNLIVFRSHGINISSNMIRMFVDDMSHNAAAMSDALISLIARRPRSVAFVNPLGRLEGAMKGLKRGGRELVTGAEPGRGVHGELMVRGFHPLRAFVKLISSGADIFRSESKRKGLVPTLPSGRVSMDDWFKLMIESISILPEAQFRLLGLGDHPFRDAVYQDVVAQEASLRKLKGNDRKVFMRTPDATTRRIALDRSLEAVYQKHGLSLNLLMGAVKQTRKTVVGDWVDALLVTPFMPFKTTPVNVAAHALNVLYPPLAAAKGLYHLGRAAKYARGARKTLNQYAAENNRRLQGEAYREGLTFMATTVFGMFINGIAATLVKMGLATGTPDDDEKLRSLDYANGRPTSINTSGLRRALTGGDPTPRTAKYNEVGELIEEGDTWRNAFFFGVLGIAAVIQANRARQEQKDIDAGLITAEDRSALEGHMKAMVEMLPELGSTMMDMTLLKGGHSVLEALTTGDYEKVTQDHFRVIGSVAMPGILAEINRSRQIFIPDMRSDEEYHALKTAFREKNVFIDWHAAFPFKRDGLGQSIERTPDGIAPFMYHLFRADKPGWIKDDPIWQHIGWVFEESGHRHKAIPAIPGRSQVLRGTKVPLEPREYERLQELVGDARREMYLRYRADKWEGMPPGRQADVLARMWSDGLKKGKGIFMRSIVDERETRSVDFIERWSVEMKRQSGTNRPIPRFIRRATEDSARESTNRPRVPPEGALVP